MAVEARCNRPPTPGRLERLALLPPEPLVPPVLPPPVPPLEEGELVPPLLVLLPLPPPLLPLVPELPELLPLPLAAKYHITITSTTTMMNMRM